MRSLARLTARNRTTGAVVATSVEVADTHLKRAVGLLGRDRLDHGHALYIVPSGGVHTWGMRFPIDVAALDADGVIVDLVSAMAPWRIRLKRRGTAGVLELPAGTLERSRTEVGHRIAFEPAAGGESDGARHR
jgi:hypothetical protein